MRALVNAPDASDGIELREVEDPVAAANQCVVEVQAASINRGALSLLEVRPDGWRPGQDVAGTVAQSAADGSGPPQGTRVVAWPEQGGWAERMAVPTSHVAALDGGVSPSVAATLPVAGVTALRLVRVPPYLNGARLLVTGATGGVGRFAIELAAAQGAAVTALVRDADRAADLIGLGAADVVEDLAAVDGPFDAVLESVGGDVLSAALRLLAPGGTLMMFGNSSREPAEIDFRTWGGGGARIVQFRIYESGEPPAHGADLALLAGMVADGRLHPLVGLVVDWTRVGGALTALRERRVAGKVVLEVS
ncbi:zinc-binding dehydrogenase [soil metagenome]